MWRGTVGGHICFRLFRLAVPYWSGRGRFHIPLIEPDWRLSRIRLSDKTSRLHPRLVAPSRSQAYEPKIPVKVREWISTASAPPDLYLQRNHRRNRIACRCRAPGTPC